MRKILSIIVFFIAVTVGSTSAQLTINGHLVGADEEPLLKTLVMAEGPHDFSVNKEVKPNGSFQLNFPSKGGYYLYLIGVHHKTVTIPVIVDRQQKVSLDIRLESHSYNENPDSIYVIGDFNDYSTKQGKLLMDNHGNGTYSRMISTEADSISYQLWGVTQTEFGGTYPISGESTSGDISVIQKAPWQSGHFATTKKVTDQNRTITFNIKQLPDTTKKQQITFSDPILDKIVSIYQDVETKEKKFGLAVRNKIQTSPEELVKKIQEEHKSILRQEQDSLLRQLLLLRYFDELHPSEGDSVLANKLMQEVPVTSPFWSLEARSSVGASNIMFIVSGITNQQRTVDTYINDVIDQHHDPDVRAQFLKVGFHRAKNNNDKKLMNRFYNMLKSEHRDSRQYEEIRRQFDANRKIQVGNQIPDFKFTVLNDTSQLYTDDYFKGKIYLIDFWGTWCGPCIEEMPILHKAYKTYKDEGFQILSVAMLDEKSDIEKFRNNEYPMPWHHTLIAKEDNARVNKMFEITSIPKPILINQKGEIIALDEQIRGEKLLSKLDEIF